MDPEELCFLPTNHDLRSADRRAWEREKAKALSHAARTAHRKKDSKKRKEQDCSLSRTAQNTPTTPTTDAKLSDPFVSFPIDLTTEDRELLHGYLVNVPRDFYGTSAASFFCPVRDVTLGILSNNQILLSWAILFMQHRIALLRNNDPFHDTRVLHRRRQTYKTMSLQIHDQQSAITEEAMYGLAFSALLEDRIGDKLTAQKHLQACLITKRLRVQKGLTVLSYPMGTLCIPVYVQVGVPEYFRSLEEVRSAGFNFKKLLWSLEEWKYGSAQSDSSELTSDSCRSLWTGSTHVSYESAQKQRSILRYHLTRSLQETSFTGVRLCLSLLATLSLILWKFHQHGSGAVEFLELLTRCFSEYDSLPGAQKVPMTMLGLLYTTFMCLDRIQQSTTGQNCVVDLWQTVDIVEFLMYAAPSSRVRVKQTLLSWILDDTRDSAASNACDYIFKEHIIEDVEASWLSQRLYEVGTSQAIPSYRYLPAPARHSLTYTSSCAELARASSRNSPSRSSSSSG